MKRESRSPQQDTGAVQPRLYGAQDMARVASSACEGCGACCRGMGDTIVLDPYDAWQLCAGTGSTFEALMGAGVDLHVEEGVILPHIMMKKETDSCFFLGNDGRCGIHAFRPGICRLFPLGRQFGKEKISYFVVPDGCVKGGLSKVRIDRWIGIPGLPRYEAYKSDWRELVRTLKARIAAEESGEVQRNINLYFLRTFYMEPYRGSRTAEKALPAEAFYREYADRAEKFTDAVL